MMMPCAIAADDNRQQMPTNMLPSLEQDLTGEGTDALQESMREGLITQEPSSPLPASFTEHPSAQEY